VIIVMVMMLNGDNALLCYLTLSNTRWFYVWK
jgi:hypothetical protein